MSWPHDFPAESLVAQRGRRFFVALRPDRPEHSEWFRMLWNQGLLKLNGQAPEQLAHFLPGSAQPEVQALLSEQHELEQSLASLGEEAEARAESARQASAALDENTDSKRVDSLLGEVESHEREARRAKVVVETARRRLSEVVEQIRQALDRERQARFDEAKASADAAAREFNRAVAEAYHDLHKILAEAAPRLVALSHPAHPWAGIVMSHPTLDVTDGSRLKKLATRPALGIRFDGDGFDFKLVPACDEEAK